MNSCSNSTHSGIVSPDVRPHRASKFGWEVRTPARQAGLTSRALTLRGIFSSRLLFVASKNVLFSLFETARPVSFPIRASTSGGLATVDDGGTANTENEPSDRHYLQKVSFGRSTTAKRSRSLKSSDRRSCGTQTLRRRAKVKGVDGRLRGEIPV
jgi:hypothetical protein